ncbi:MAG TPA: aminodeoxychorismate synthase component I, partial [Acinetobacter ursingii]|nr:aminodeoxychorismate synthase component I [Acinetobacter ursingii]
MKFFCKLNQNIRSTSEILFKLHSTHGLVFLEDQNHPVIAFNPRHYVVCNNKQFKYFKINSIYQYEMMD